MNVKSSVTPPSQNLIFENVGIFHQCEDFKQNKKEIREICDLLDPVLETENCLLNKVKI